MKRVGGATLIWFAVKASGVFGARPLAEVLVADAGQSPATMKTDLAAGDMVGADIAGLPGEAKVLCQCFCGMRTFTKKKRNIVQDAGSVRFVFDPQPIVVGSGGLKELTERYGENLHALASFIDGKRTRFREYFTGLHVQAFPDVDDAERDDLLSKLNKTKDFSEYLLAHLSQLAHAASPDSLGSLQTQMAKFIKASEEEGTLVESRFRKMLEKNHEPPQVMIHEVANYQSQPYLGRALCIKVCKDDILDTPPPLARIMRHAEYGIYKPKQDPPNVGQIISTERPHWGRQRVQLPDVQTFIDFNSTKFQDWTRKMKFAWQPLFAQAARFDPYTGLSLFDNTNKIDSQLMSLFHIDTSLTCPQLRDLVQKNTPLKTTWSTVQEKLETSRAPDELFGWAAISSPGLVPEKLPPLSNFIETSSVEAAAPVTNRAPPKKQSNSPLSRPLVPYDWLHGGDQIIPEQIVNEEGGYLPIELDEMEDARFRFEPNQAVGEYITAEYGIKLTNWPVGWNASTSVQITPSFRFFAQAAYTPSGNDVIPYSIYSGHTTADQSEANVADSRQSEFLNFRISDAERQRIKAKMSDLIKDWFIQSHKSLQLAEGLRPAVIWYNSFEYHGALMLSCYTGLYKDGQRSNSVVSFVVKPIVTKIHFLNGHESTLAPSGRKERVVTFLSDYFSVPRIFSSAQPSFEEALARRFPDTYDALFVNMGHVLGGRAEISPELPRTFPRNMCLINPTDGEVTVDLPTFNSFPKTFYSIAGGDRPGEGGFLTYANSTMASPPSLEITNALALKCYGAVLPGAKVNKVDPNYHEMLPAIRERYNIQYVKEEKICVDRPDIGRHRLILPPLDLPTIKPSASLIPFPKTTPQTRRRLRRNTSGNHLGLSGE